MMLVELATAAVMKAGSRVVAALIEDRDLDQRDLSSAVTGLLEAVVAGNKRSAEEFDRIVERLDRLTVQPYVAAVAAGRRLLADAAPDWRVREDRQRLLADARLRFADAIGYAPDEMLRAQAETQYGLCWLASGARQDAALAFARAARIVEDEVLATMSKSIEDYRRWQRPPTTFEQFRNAVFGPDPLASMKVSGAGTPMDRLWGLTSEHEALQTLRGNVFGDSERYPPLRKPIGADWDKPGTALIVPVDGNAVIDLFGIEVRSTGGMVRVTNHRAEPILVAGSFAGADPAADNSWLARLSGPPDRNPSKFLLISSFADTDTVAPGVATRALPQRAATAGDHYRMIDVRVYSGQDSIGVVRFARPLHPATQTFTNLGRAGHIR